VRNLAIRPVSDLQPGAQVVAAMPQATADNLRLLEPDPDQERFYIDWHMRQDLTRYCLRTEDVECESAWTVVSVHNDGKWTELRLALAVLREDGHLHPVTWDLCERAQTRVEVIEQPRRRA